MNEKTGNENEMMTLNAAGKLRWDLDRLAMELRDRLQSDPVVHVPYTGPTKLTSPLAISTSGRAGELLVWSDGDWVASVSDTGQITVHPAAVEWSVIKIEAQLREDALAWLTEQVQTTWGPRGYVEEGEWYTGDETEVRVMFARPFASVDELVAELEAVREADLDYRFDENDFDWEETA